MQRTTRNYGYQKYGGFSLFKCLAAASTLVALFALAFPCMTRAQLATADVLGRVTDATGAVVTEASVTLTNTSTGIVKTVKTDKLGEYLFSHVQIGPYKVSVEANGFKKYALNNLVLAVGDRVRADARLEVGSQVETVEVAGAVAPALKTDSSTANTLISTENVQDMPLNGRNYVNLVQLSAGVNEGDPRSSLAGTTVADRRLTSSISANGQPDTANGFLVDGMDNNERAVGTQVLKPSVDAIDQVNVMTSLFTAEYTHSTGAVINVVTKAGGNKFHGSLYEYFRNDKLNAYTWNNGAGKGTGKPEFRQNQFGGSIGGPILKNKTFFFFDYEGFRQVSAADTGSETAPQASLEALVANTAVGSTIPEEFTDYMGPNHSTVVVPANTVTVSELGKTLMSLYPAPNNGDNGMGDYSYGPKDVRLSKNIDLRVDHHISAKDQVFGRYSWNHLDADWGSTMPLVTIDGNSFANGAALPTNPGNSTIIGEGSGLDWVHVFSANKLFEGKAGWTRFYNIAAPSNGMDAATKLGFAACPAVNPNTASNLTTFCTNNPYGGSNVGLPQINVGHYSGLGDGSSIPINNINNSFTYSGTLNWTHNAHNIKTGVSLIRRQLFYTTSTNGRGLYNINGIMTGSVIADMIEGVASSISQSVTLTAGNYRAWEPGAYIQDDWRARPWLTINAGVRYDIFSPTTEKGGELSNFNMKEGILQSPDLLGIYHSGTTGGIQTSFNNVAPRLGFAATLPHSMVVRGGMGISYTAGAGSAPANYPFIWSVAYGGDSTQVTPPSGMAAYTPAQIAAAGQSTTCTSNTVTPMACGINIAAGVPDPISDVSTVSNLPSGTSIAGINDNIATGRIVQYILEVQKEFGANVVAVSFVGNSGRHLSSSQNVNMAAYATVSPASTGCSAEAYDNAGGGPGSPGPGCIFIQGPMPYTSSATADGQDLSTGDNYKSVTMSMGGASALYSSMQATFTRRMSKGLMVNANYTWSRALGSNSGATGECVAAGCIKDLGNGNTKTLSGPNDWNWGNNSLDLRQRLAGMIDYQLPFARNAHGVLAGVAKGWDANASFTESSGQNSQILNGNGTNVSGLKGLGGSDVPEQISKIKYLHGIGGSNKWFDTSSWGAQTPGELGDAGMDSVYGPRLGHTDFSLSKDFGMWEKTTLHFRAEAFNLTNTPQFQFSNNATGMGPSFGVIDSVNPGSYGRQLQFALKLTF